MVGYYESLTIHELFEVETLYNIEKNNLFRKERIFCENNNLTESDMKTVNWLFDQEINKINDILVKIKNEIRTKNK